GLPTTASFGAFERAWTGAKIDVYFRNSAIVTVSTVVLTVVCATLAGYSFGKIRWRLRGPVYFFVLAWLAIPPLLMMVPIYVEMVQLGVLQLQSRFVTDYPALMAGLLITSLPVIAAYLIFQRHLVRGIVAGAVK